MKRGIVLDINSDHLIVLTKSGDFVKAKKVSNCSVGEEIPFQIKRNFFNQFQFPELNIKIPSFQLKMVSAVALAFILIFSQFSSFTHSNDVYAYMAIDINPSMELSVNEDLEVINIQTFNEDAEIVVRKLKNWKFKDIKEVTKEIVRLCGTSGYLDNGKVLITTTYVEDQEKVKEKLQEAVQEVEQEVETEASVAVTTIEATEEDHNTSEELNISVGKYVQEQSSKKTKKETKVEVEIEPKQESPKNSNKKSQLPSENPSMEKKEKDKKPNPSNEKRNSTPSKSKEQKNEKEQPSISNTLDKVINSLPLPSSKNEKKEEKEVEKEEKQLEKEEKAEEKQQKQEDKGEQEKNKEDIQLNINADTEIKSKKEESKLMDNTSLNIDFEIETMDVNLDINI